MRYKLSECVELQLELDARIFELHQRSRQNTQGDRCLALMVEIAELANETRCFKYWSTKGASDKAVLLEELSDSVHFMLSLGIDLKDYDAVYEGQENTMDLSEAFRQWMASAGRLSSDFTLENFNACKACLAEVASLLNFSEQDLLKMYFKKNEKNHHRQDVNY